MYLLCYHSEEPDLSQAAKHQFLVVESAIKDGVWPYDNGDDPSFFVARQGGPLTWGVCRPDVRNSIRVGSIVAFLSFTSLLEDQVLYRFCAVTTVRKTLDVRAVHEDQQFAGFRDLYINALIRPDKNGWRYDESDRPEGLRHRDWLWRIAHHDCLPAQGIKDRTKKGFNERYAQVYRDELIPNDQLKPDNLQLANNYILFSTSADDSYICNKPPEVAISFKGKSEKWSEKQLESLTVGTAFKYHVSGRNYLRVENRSGRNVHRQIRFQMPTTEAVAWREKLICALKAADKTGKPRQMADRLAKAGKCSDRS